MKGRGKYFLARGKINIILSEMNIIEKKVSVLAITIGLVAVFSLALVSTVQAGALTDASTTLSTTYGDRAADYNISFVVASSTQVGGQIHLVFPSGYGLPAATAAGESLATSTVVASLTKLEGEVASITVTSDSIVLWLADGAIAVAADTLNLSNIGVKVKNKSAGGSLQVGVETRTLAGDAEDSASTTAVTIVGSPAEQSKQTSTKTTGPPSSKITSPTVGQVSAVGQNLIIQGTASDLGLYDVSKVEVSVDNGNTWTPANLTKVSASNFTWEYIWGIPAAGTYSIKSRATDTAGNVEIPGKGVTLDISSVALEATPAKPVVEKPIAQMTASELQARIADLQQKVVILLMQLVSVLTQQLQG